MKQNLKIGAIILAAGSSSRFGEPKQLLELDGLTFIEKTIESALQSDLSPIVVVGANKERILPVIKRYPVKEIENSNWENGIGSSISKGVALAKKNGFDAVVILVCDQPFVTGKLLKELINTYLSADSKIVCCAYQDTLGVPALFDKDLFGELMKLGENEGAKKMFSAYRKVLSYIQFPEASIDIDTIEDYKKFKESKNSI